MSTLIELAVQRLQQLQGAKAQVPSATPTAGKRERDGQVAAVAGHQSGPDLARRDAVSRQIELSADSMTKAGIFPAGSGPLQQSDQFRLMKRPLIRNVSALKEAGQPRANLIMVTSALAGEGKSFTAANLAMSMASELDHTVLLVDADVARPSLARMLGFDAGVGLLDVLEGRTSLPKALLKTDIDKLSILPSGVPRARATELLASEVMRSVLDEIALRYSDRIVIFDSPPLLQTTEASVLASHMGQIVIVVQADSTPQADVQRALLGIAAHPVRLLVLNRVHNKLMHGPGYGYGYGYGYQADA